MDARQRMSATAPNGGRYTVALAGTWECGNCAATGEASVEEGDTFEVNHVCGEEA